MTSSALVNRLPISNLLKWSHSVLNKYSQHFYSQKPKCGKSLEPQCGDRFKNYPCGASEETIKTKTSDPPALPQENPEIKLKQSIDCCGDPCTDALPHFDKLYYRRSDKSQRVYQQTWNECPQLFIKPKVICSEPIKPKWKKRQRKDRPKTACKQDVCLLSKTKCPHIRMPQCRAGRKPPACLTERKPAKCVKRRAPYPSFSECRHKPSKSKYPIECRCLAIPSICEVWAYYHKQQDIKKTN